MTDLENAYQRAFEGSGTDRIGKILTLTKQLQEIDSAISTIRYDNRLFEEIPEVIKTLGAAKDALVAELKTV